MKLGIVLAACGAVAAFALAGCGSVLGEGPRTGGDGVRAQPCVAG